MSYCIKTIVEPSFDDAVLKITEHLKNEGFSVLTEINVQETLKRKIDISTINPKESMQASKNSELEIVAEDISSRLERVIKSL